MRNHAQTKLRWFYLLLQLKDFDVTGISRPASKKDCFNEKTKNIYAYTVRSLAKELIPFDLRVDDGYTQLS